MNLYRNTRDGMVGGVCAGLADHWDVAHWVVRLLCVMAFLFTGTLAFWAYVAGWFLLAPRRFHDHERYAADQPIADMDITDEENVAMEYDERRHRYREKKMFRYNEPGSVRLRRAKERLDAALRRVETMEAYVTSRQFELNKEFSKL
jgi:phage shock protein C